MGHVPKNLSKMAGKSPMGFQNLFLGGLAPHEIELLPQRIYGGVHPHKKLKNQCKTQKCSEIGLYVSYRAQNLHAEIFLVVIRWLYRPKVPKVSKFNDFDNFLSRCWRSSGADSMGPWVPHSGLGRSGDLF